MKVRMKFSKNGPIKFIGHLDVMRYFQKAIRRAEIDIAYSQGFSPHQIMSFAQPLGVGVESNGEYVDVELNTAVSSKDVMDKLNAVMNEGIKIESVKKLPEGAINAMASVAASKYLISIKDGYDLDVDFFSQCAKLSQKEHIYIVKKTKKSEVEMDLKPAIFEMNVTEDGLMMFVDSSSSGNIKPNLVLEEACKENGMEYNPLAFAIRRLDMYTRNQNGELVSMDEVGEDF